LRPVSRATHIVTVYDMTHELFPEKFRAPKRTSRANRRAEETADHIICISDSNKRDLVRLLDVPPEKVAAIPLGLSTRFAELAASGQILEPIHKRPYISHVGQRGGYESFDRFISVFGRSAHVMREFDILSFGGGAPSAAEVEAIRKVGIDPASASNWRKRRPAGSGLSACSVPRLSFPVRRLWLSAAGSNGAPLRCGLQQYEFHARGCRRYGRNLQSTQQRRLGCGNDYAGRRRNRASTFSIHRCPACPSLHLATLCRKHA